MLRRHCLFPLLAESYLLREPSGPCAEVLVSRTQDFVRADTVRNALRLFDGESILVSEGDQWRQQRRLLQQGFRSERLRGYARMAVEHTQEMLLKWPAAGPIRADNEMAELCMRILSQVLLGTQPRRRACRVNSRRA